MRSRGQGVQSPALGLVLWTLLWTVPACTQQGDQSLPLTVSGTVTTGFFQSNTEDAQDISAQSALAGIRLSVSGYLHDPRFLRFEFKPQGTLGQQSSDVSLNEGNGLSASATFLGSSRFPLTVSYTRLGRHLVTFGNLNPLSGLEADTSQNTLTVDWRLLLRRLPEIRFNFSRYDDHYQTSGSAASTAENAGRSLSIDLRDRRWGWDFNSQFRTEKTTTDLLSLVVPGAEASRFNRDLRELRVAASREAGNWLNLNFNGGRTSSDNLVADRPFSQDYGYLFASAYLRPSEKLTANLTAGFNSNLTGFRVEELLGGSTGGALGGGPLNLLPLESRVTLLTFSGRGEYMLTRDLRVDGEVRRDRTFAPGNLTFVSPESSLTSMLAGVSYFHDFRRWQLRARYSTNVGRVRTDALPVSHSSGHDVLVSATLGAWHAWEVAVSTHGQWQDVSNGISLINRSLGGSISAARPLLAGWRFRASYSRDSNFFQAESTKYDSTGRSMTVAVEHRRVMVTLTRRQQDGFTFQPDLLLPPRPPLQAQAANALLPLPLLVIPSSSSWTGFAVTANPVSRLTARATWGHNIQRFSGSTINDFSQWEASAGYRFRMLTLEAGYLRYGQDLGSHDFSRRRLFVRVSRDFRMF